MRKWTETLSLVVVRAGLAGGKAGRGAGARGPGQGAVLPGGGGTHRAPSGVDGPEPVIRPTGQGEASGESEGDGWVGRSDPNRGRTR